tara:strand:- start:866 stop:1111 length:246 start_codon:yes stop_codon:yes gene_type:complete
MELKLIDEKKVLNEEKIIDLQHDNSRIYRKIEELQKEISSLLKDIDKNKSEIYELCDHKMDSERVYGERPQYFCVKCGYNP